MFIDSHHGYNHGDYWSQPFAPAPTSIAAHSLPAPNALAQNSIPARDLPSRPSFG